MIRKERALTLIELVITASIFVAIMAAVYSAFHTGMFGYRHIEETIDAYQAARQALERINLDLRNSFAYSAQDTRFAGNKNTLSFLTIVDTFSKAKIMQDYAFVSYRLEGNKLMRLCRRSQEALNDKSGIGPQEMAVDAKDIIFSYGYKETDGREIKWKNSWDDREVLPLAVKVKLTLGNKTKQEFERTIFYP